MGSGSQVLNEVSCLVQRLTVATVNSHLPIALDNQPANLCNMYVGTHKVVFIRWWLSHRVTLLLRLHCMC